MKEIQLLKFLEMPFAAAKLVLHKNDILLLRLILRIVIIYHLGKHMG
jgi:hypothetical protein